MNKGFLNGLLSVGGQLFKVCMGALAYRKEELIPANDEALAEQGSLYTYGLHQQST